MAKRLIWAPVARLQLREIIYYWNSHNQSTTYTKKLRKHLRSVLKLVSYYPEIGKRTIYPNNKVRAKSFMDNFLIIYRVDPKNIIILNFWDNRQDPETNIYLKK
ncbi:MAG: type II toxin-antitoxin system RelE/ParE family toxin [Chitinophagales bacterium]